MHFYRRVVSVLSHFLTQATRQFVPSRVRSGRLQATQKTTPRASKSKLSTNGAMSPRAAQLAGESCLGGCSVETVHCYCKHPDTVWNPSNSMQCRQLLDRQRARTRLAAELETPLQPAQRSSLAPFRSWLRQSFVRPSPSARCVPDTTPATTHTQQQTPNA